VGGGGGGWWVGGGGGGGGGVVRNSFSHDGMIDYLHVSFLSFFFSWLADGDRMMLRRGVFL